MQGRKKESSGVIGGYGIDRMQIEVPVNRVDENPPAEIMKECKDLMLARRKKLMTTFTSNIPY
jgi:hypothetical protein